MLLIGFVSCEYKTIVPDTGEPIDPEVPISFSAEVEPIWTTQGCTGCHDGSPFSLLSGDAYESLTTRGLLDMDNATNSKILTFPGTNSHSNYNYVGNQRDVIKVWIEQGALDN